MSKIPEGTQFIEAGCGEKGFRKYEKGCWWFFEGFWRHVDWKMGDLRPLTEHPFYIDPATTWTGEGLPPVGTVCAFCRFPSMPEPEWQKVEIVANWSEGLKSPVAIFMSTSFAPQADQAIAECFRPIRTAEQVAADARNAQIMGLADELAGYQDRETGDKHKKLAEYLHDNGYRKEVQP
ncbi:hypothetical protein ACI2KS_10125 [Pseudomonas sp. NPDC087358]|uniref:hypothetical protein n=1 Tax=Pseudomonas sp. NPDC087358 TaxID=3364439 RepID=UPI00384BC7CA